MKVQSNNSVSNGNYINWNQPIQVPSSHFQHDSVTTTIKQAGTYQVSVRYTLQCSTHGNGAANIDLYVSGSVVARLYHGQSDGYQQSRCMVEILNLKASDTLQVMYRSNGNSIADQYGNEMLILLLD